MVREAHLDWGFPSASTFHFSICEFVYLYAFVSWDPGYVDVGVVILLQEFKGTFGDHDG